MNILPTERQKAQDAMVRIVSVKLKTALIGHPKGELLRRYVDALTTAYGREIDPPDEEIAACRECNGTGYHIFNGDDCDPCGECGGTGDDPDDALRVGILVGAIQPPKQEEPAA